MGIQKWQKRGEAAPVTPIYYGKSIVHQQLVDPRGKEHDFYFYHLKDSVVVLPVTADGDALIVREYKQGSEEIQEGLVGGYLNPGETFEMAARREVREETGYEAGQIIDLGHVWIIPRHSNGKVQLFLALGCQPVGEQIPDEAEEMNLVKIHLNEWIAKVINGETKETFSIAATIRALPHLGYALKSP